ncbi:MAG: CoB--CoM heterodisulfide reductase iron-sulfur subunit A family protein [Bacteroidales bacterium]|nr:CoB--CoM heterodisulfide reductase iron-sulfur subunit A family protein [Bacteroidales bacterium]
MPENKILVAGGGISGITTAIEAAEAGNEVILIEKLPYLGGRVALMNRYFPKLCPPYCGLEINFRRIKDNKRIRVLTSTEITNISGNKGNFNVELIKKPEFVNENCTVCGECEKVCPVERPDEFNYNTSKTKAIYLPHEMAFPYKYIIDEKYCLKFNCNKCLEACKYDAINLSAQAKIINEKVTGIVFATGWKPYDASLIENLGFDKFPDVITNVMMERLAAPNGPTNGKILRPSDNKKPKTIAFVQCAGSRDEKHLPYCSAVCCSASLKQAIYIIEKEPETKIKIFYIDLRLSGRNEDFLNKVKEIKNIELIKGKVGLIEQNPENKALIASAENIMSGKIIKEEFDMIVLATGMQPEAINLKNIKCDESGFIIPEFLEDGIFAASCSKKPLDVSASLKDATGMALKAIQTLIG